MSGTADPSVKERMLLVLDEGTSSTRALLYAPDGTMFASAQRDITQYYPRPGWVEHDAAEILVIIPLRHVKFVLDNGYEHESPHPSPVSGRLPD